MVTIGHASIDERGAARGGSAGDQTGREVCTRSWYDKKWLCCIRAKDRKVADRIAKAMEQAVANDKIGYDQDQRTTCYDRAKEVGWDLSKITTACECDCSSLVAVCVNAAGISVSQHIWTGNEEAALLATGAFESMRESNYLTQDAYLARGDILVSNSHTAIVLTNGSKYATVPETQTNAIEPTITSETDRIDPAKSFLSKLAGKYTVTATALNVRSGAGTDHAILDTIPNGASVRNYGYFTTAQNGKKWLYITGVVDGRNVEGFCSEVYLKKG